MKNIYIYIFSDISYVSPWDDGVSPLTRSVFVFVFGSAPGQQVVPIHTCHPEAVRVRLERPMGDRRSTRRFEQI